jgi:hypothetical protein
MINYRPVIEGKLELEALPDGLIIALELLPYMDDDPVCSNER